MSKAKFIVIPAKMEMNFADTRFVVFHELSLTSFNAGVDGIYEIYAQ